MEEIKKKMHQLSGLLAQARALAEELAEDSQELEEGDAVDDLEELLDDGGFGAGIEGAEGEVDAWLAAHDKESGE